MSITYLGDNGPDGTSLGLTTSELISFYGTTTVAQPSSASQDAAVATTTTTSTTTALTVDLDDVRVLLNQLRSDLVTLGLIKGAV